VYVLTPLGEHYDDGFGAVGDAFLKAAEALKTINHGDHRLYLSHLPEIYLLRHAVELFLKSGIIILHRRLRLPYDSEPHTSSTPRILASSGKWKSLQQTHDLTELYAYWKKLIAKNETHLLKIMKHAAELSVPAELDEWIKKIAEIDPSSDYFRYPVSKNADADKKKSPFKEVSLGSLAPKEHKAREYPRALIAEARKRDEYLKALFVEDSQGELAKVFVLDRSANQEVLEAVREAAEMLSTFHFMMRVELTGGW
jgi:hypothetical protein